MSVFVSAVCVHISCVLANLHSVPKIESNFHNVMQEVEVPGANMTIALVLIDTVLLAGKSDPKNMYSSPFGPESQKTADDQWAWIDQTLAKYSKPDSRVGWKFVAGHYPGTCRYFKFIVKSDNRSSNKWTISVASYHHDV